MSTSIFALEKVNILIIHSYSQEYEWTKGQHTSFVSTLKNTTENIHINSEYLDTKRLKLNADYTKEFIRYLKVKYPTLPNIVYVTDDNALNFIYNHYKELFSDIQIPVFFSGVNNLDMKSMLPKELFTGVYEIKDINPNIELIKQFSPQTRKIYFIGDNSSTYQSIKKEIKSQEKNFKNLEFHYISDKYITNVQNQLPKEPRSFILLTTIGNFKDDNNISLQVQESIKSIRKNTNLIILSMEDAYMYPGVIGGYVTSASQQGLQAAKLVLNYLKNKSLKNISALTESPNIYIFNSKELINSRVILSEYIARNAAFINKDKTFVENNKDLLINILLTGFFIFILIAITVYAIQKKKYSHLENSSKKIYQLREKLYIKDQLLTNTFHIGNIGYWKLDTISDTLFVSKGLLNILKIDSNIYKDDSQLINYYIHSADKVLFDEMFFKVRSSSDFLVFNHRMVSINKEILNVRHLMYTENTKHESSSTIIGIIQFEKC